MLPQYVPPSDDFATYTIHLQLKYPLGSCKVIVEIRLSSFFLDHRMYQNR